MRHLGDIKVEVKNMNSFRAVERALLIFEQERQTRILESGNDTRVTETRGWVETSGETVSQRTKEEAHDYRYFPGTGPAAVAALASRGWTRYEGRSSLNCRRQRRAFHG